MQKKKIIIILITIIIVISFVFFFFFFFKDVKVGHNKSSQEIVDYILSINSYETEVTVEVKSNKNNNKYILKQTHENPNKSIQEVIEPSNISGVKIINEENNLKIENTNLQLTNIFENYNYLGNNCLDLYSFIKDYKNNNISEFEEKDDEIIMKTKSNTENIYTQNKILYVDKKTYKPIKMEIKDNKQNTTIYILYNEVKVSSLK